MEKDLLDKMKYHASHIAANLVQQILPNGSILVSYNDDVIEDIVSEHHILEMFNSLSNSIFIGYIELMLGNIVNNKSGYISPFVLDSLSDFKMIFGDKLDKIVNDTILNTQLASGAVPVFTAHIRGGDYFSSLWAAKILTKFDKEKYSEELVKIITFLLAHKDDYRTISQLGFLVYVLKIYDAEKYKDEINNLVNDLISQSKKKTYLWFDNLIETIFTSIDILVALDVLDDPVKKLRLIEKTLIHLFTLEKDDKGLPTTLKNSIENYSESLIFESFTQLVILVNLYLLRVQDNSLALKVNSVIHANNANKNYESKLQSRELKSYKREFKPMRESFKKYENTLEEIWKAYPFEKSIFIMMPFRFDSDARYERIRDAIKDAAKKQGFTAFLSNDEGRRFRPGLWENLVVNMLSCKYGIAVLPIEKVPNPLDGHKLKVFNNPNVALEFGFMVSRCEENVLILTESIKDLPSDIRGLLVEKFDLGQPYKGIFNAITKWLNEIKKKANKEKE